MSIPIIISRKKSNGQQYKININSASTLLQNLEFDKTFNPITLKQIKQTNAIKEDTIQQQYQKIICDSDRKPKINSSRDKIRKRISSSNISRRFPKDFFKSDGQKQKKRQKQRQKQKQRENQSLTQNNYQNIIPIISNNTQNIKNIFKIQHSSKDPNSLLYTLKRINSCKTGQEKNLFESIFNAKKNIVKDKHKTFLSKQKNYDKINKNQDYISQTPKFSAKASRNSSEKKILSKKQNKQSVTLDSELKVFKKNYYNKKQLKMNINHYQPFQPEILAFNEHTDNFNPHQQSQRNQSKMLKKINLLQYQKIKHFKIKSSSTKSSNKKISNKNYEAGLKMVRKQFTQSQKQNKNNKQNTNLLVSIEKIKQSNNSNKKRKFVCIGGQKIGLQQNSQGQYKIKMSNP